MKGTTHEKSFALANDITGSLPKAANENKQYGTGKMTSCFICDDRFEDNGCIPLSVGCTSYSKTRLPTKIGQLMGDDIMVVIARDDMLCKRCTALLNRLDKLENDMGVVQKCLRGYLYKKYKLMDFQQEDDIKEEEEKSDCSTEELVPEPENVTSPFNPVKANGENRVMKKCLTCDFETTFPGVLKSHQARCRSRQLSYRCSMCDKKFLSAKHVRQHVMAAHLSNWPCHYCGANFSEETEYTSHMKTHVTTLVPQAQTNSSVNYNCDSCSFQTTNYKLFEEHNSCHKNSLYTCTECNENFEDENNYVVHVNGHKQTEMSDTSTCNLCSSTFDCTEKLDEHLVGHHIAEQLGTVQVELEEGHYELRSLETLESSIPTAADNNIIGSTILSDNLNIEYYFCNRCSLAFDSPTLFLEHNKSHSDVQQIDLPLCKGEMDCDYQYEINEHLEEMFKTIQSNKKIESEEIPNDTINDTSSNTFVTCDIQNVEESGFQFSNPGSENCDNTRQESLFLLSHSEFINEQDEGTKLLGSSDISAPRDDAEDPEVQNHLPENQACDIFEMVRLKKLSSVSLDVDEMPLLLGTLNKFQISSSVTSLSAPTTSTNEDDTNNGELATVSSTTKTYTCIGCSYVTSSTKDLLIHRKEHDAKEQFNCTICEEQFCSKPELEQHMMIHTTLTEIFKCQYCLLDFADKYSLQEHILKRHPYENQMHTCLFCCKTLPSKKALRNHEESHSDKFNNKFICNICNQTFQKDKQLKNHLNFVHRDPHCRFCGKEILKAKTLKFHELRHVRNKVNYDCEVCDRTFKTRTGQIHHQATHTGDYKYFCSFCGHGFMSRMMMEEHRSKHTKEERYVCDICGKKFNFQSTYWIHRKWHDNPYPYKCTFCDRLFRHSSLLAVHRRKHTGERPYKCPHCPMAFSVGGTLKRHTILHTGRYPFTCQLCKRGFTTKHKYACHLSKVHDDGEMLRSQGPPCEYKVVLPEPVEATREPVDWEPDVDDPEGRFALDLGEDCGEIVLQGSEELVPCTIVGDSILVDDIGPRVVEIIMDDTSQSAAVATLGDDTSILSGDLWSYQ